jgi:hypothetical protein
MKMKQQWTFLIKRKSTNLLTPDLSNTFQFWSLLILGISSSICSLFIFYHYLSDPIRRHALHNHVVLIIIMANIIFILTDLSWTLDSLRRPGHILSSTPAFCMIWWFIDFTLSNTQRVILAWGSIEHHILIFHNTLVSTSKKRFVYHYLPLMILIIYLFSFYIGVIFLSSCNNKFEFTSIQCGSNFCYLNIKSLVLWDLIIHNILPTFIIAIFNLALLYRIIAQKNRIQQANQWRKNRRMSMQILLLSAVYLFLHFPLTILILVQLFQDTKLQFSFGVQFYIFFLTYSVTLLLPFVIYLNYLFNDKHQHRRISPPVLTFSQHQRMYAPDIAIIK